MTSNVVKQIRRATRRRFTSEAKYSNRVGGTPRRDPHHRTVPERKDSTFDLLPVVQSLPGFG